MSRVVVAASPLAGHTFPMIQIAGELVTAGHDVTFVGGERFADHVAQVGATLRPLTGKAAYDDRRMAEFFPERFTLSPGPEMLTWDISHVFGDAIPDQHALIQELLTEDPDAVVVAELMFLGGLPSLHGAGVRPRRWIGVGISPLYYPSDDTTPFGPAPVAPGTEQVEANRAMNAGLAAALSGAAEHLQRVVEGLGATGFTMPNYFATMYTEPDDVLQLTVPEFEFPRSDLPENLVRFVGPLPPVAPESWTEPAWWPELDGDRPVVVVTQGTLANDDLSELVEPTLAAFDGEDVLVVAALGRPAAALTWPVPANAVIEEFVPFDRLLPRADVFVTNGGYGATQQALAAGVPVVVAGQTEDKPAIAARVGLLGLGIDLRTQRPKPEEVAGAVRQILTTPSYRDRVAELSRAYEKVDGLRLITDVVAEAFRK
ncbi:nucleotide disphospho-sugar-binding domain-containing protein [Lentzea rhizosphaerae]|uniref:Nucleotide disphospho-sugar-binding domain-containing protein n=1 Tax=Lentzea rhizosphaerae TaxID=2041025 RepID=A0ABV8BM17_9PSEU